LITDHKYKVQLLHIPVNNDPPVIGLGFNYNPTTGIYNVIDPTGVRSRDYNAVGTKQPYATNLANALEHLDKRVDHKQLVDFS
jgi:hypothetical protein